MRPFASPADSNIYSNINFLYWLFMDSRINPNNLNRLIVSL